MSRISLHLEGIGKQKLLIPFFTAGYPTLRQSLEMVKIATDCGADFVELGMPFSDPLADGPVIQHSSHVALQRGANLKCILDGVQGLRNHIETPLILMGYLNPIIAYGSSKFLSRAARVGVDGLIIPDLPVEEAIDLGEEIEQKGMSTILLISPTSPRPRWKNIDRYSTDFVYAVTVTGVTGSGQKFDNNTDHYLRLLKRSLSKPFVAGFGVDSPEAAKRLCRSADGIVIGSALIRLMDSASNAAEARRKVAKFLTSIRKAIS